MHTEVENVKNRYLGGGCKLGMRLDVHGALVSFPALPTVQVLIACSMQEWMGKAWYIEREGLVY